MWGEEGAVELGNQKGGPSRGAHVLNAYIHALTPSIPLPPSATLSLVQTEGPCLSNSVDICYRSLCVCAHTVERTPLPCGPILILPARWLLFGAAR